MSIATLKVADGQASTPPVFSMRARANGRRLVPATVVIPAHNAAAFVAEAIRSVQEQTVDVGEIIVVDDGSSDDTAKIAQGFGVRVVRQKNMGLSGARNSAIRLARQPWVAFLDADDIWEPRKLERQWEAIENCPDVGVVFSDFRRFDRDGVRDHTFLSQMPHYPKLVRTPIVPGVALCNADSLRRVFFKGNFIAPSTLLVRRSLLMQVNLFDQGLTHMEDRDLCLRLLPVTRFAVVEEPLLRSRLHDHNWSNNSLGMVLSAIGIAERIAAEPERYPPGAAEQYERDLPSFYLHAGRLAEENGDTEDARNYFRRSWQCGGGVVPLARSIITTAPSPFRGWFVALGHRLLTLGNLSSGS